MIRSIKTLGALILMAITLAACSSENHDEEQVPLSGVVQDSYGTPISNCLVSPANRPEENAVMTDSSGSFETGVYPGKQKITVTCPDVNLKGEVTVNVPSAGKNDVEITAK